MARAAANYSDRDGSECAELVNISLPIYYSPSSVNIYMCLELFSISQPINWVGYRGVIVHMYYFNVTLF
jgi:hypothetical protein